MKLPEFIQPHRSILVKYEGYVHDYVPVAVGYVSSKDVVVYFTEQHSAIEFVCYPYINLRVSEYNKTWTAYEVIE